MLFKKKKQREKIDIGVGRDWRRQKQNGGTSSSKDKQQYILIFFDLFRVVYFPVVRWIIGAIVGVAVIPLLLLLFWLDAIPKPIAIPITLSQDFFDWYYYYYYYFVVVIFHLLYGNECCNYRIGAMFVMQLSSNPLRGVDVISPVKFLNDKRGCRSFNQHGRKCHRKRWFSVLLLPQTIPWILTRNCITIMAL